MRNQPLWVEVGVRIEEEHMPDQCHDILTWLIGHLN